MFSLNKCWWQLHTFSFIGRRTFGPSEGPFSHPHRRVGCDSWRLHWGTIRELGHSVSVQCFIMTSLFVFPFPYYLLCPYLYIAFVVLLCLVYVCLSITFIVRNTFFSTHMASTPHTHIEILGPMPGLKKND